MNRVFAFIPLIGFAAMAVYFWMGLQQDPSAIPSQLIDEPVPVFSLEPIQGFDQGLSNADFEGEVVLLNFFGSWCPPCLIEHPMLMEIARSGDVPIYAIDWKDEPGAGAAWLARQGNPFIRIGDDQSGRTAIDFGVTGAPETFVIDRQGRVRYRHVGVITEEVWEETLLPMVEALKRS